MADAFGLLAFNAILLFIARKAILNNKPTPLSTAAARLATRRCPTHADGGEAESASAGACFPEHELVVEPEPDESETAAANPEVNRVLELNEDARASGLIRSDFEEKAAEYD